MENNIYAGNAQRNERLIKVLAGAVIAMGIALSSQYVRAGGGGFKPIGATEVTQLMNNAELAMIAIEEKLQTVEQIQQTYLGRLQQIKKSIGEYTAPFQSVYQSYQKIMNLQSELKSMKGRVEHMKANLDDRYREFAASSLTWEDWMQREARAVSYGDARARAKLETNRRAFEGVKESMDGYQKAVQGMEDTPGVHQAVRQLAPMLQMLGGDMNRLIAITSQANLIEAEEHSQQMAKDEAQAIEMRARSIDAENARKKTQEVFDAMRNKAKTGLGSQ